MSPESSPRPRVGVPYRTRNEEVTGLSAKLANYLEAVRQAGAEPVPISLLLAPDELGALARTLDGVVLTGSPADVDPARFGATRQPECDDPDVDRERTDFALLEHAFAEDKPVLAICFGIQSLNVFLGGTLIQDIPSAIHTTIEHEWHREQGAPEPFHAARIEPGSQLAQLAGTKEARVNSSHHQSVKDPGQGLRIAARAPDGVVEAVEWTGDSNWVMGVQWHPERMAATDVLAQSLFRSLVSAAAARKTPARS
ncbi:MAG TPA: gamma-glutamyl-gamma-aminobutyrate hydrolase family protein [Candidatus Acidoferrales bacterium]